MEPGDLEFALHPFSAGLRGRALLGVAGVLSLSLPVSGSLSPLLSMDSTVLGGLYLEALKRHTRRRLRTL